MTVLIFLAGTASSSPAQQFVTLVSNAEFGTHSDIRNKIQVIEISIIS